MVVEAILDDHRQRADGLAGVAVGPERSVACGQRPGGVTRHGGAAAGERA